MTSKFKDFEKCSNVQQHFSTEFFVIHCVFGKPGSKEQQICPLNSSSDQIIYENLLRHVEHPF